MPTTLRKSASKQEPLLQAVVAPQKSDSPKNKDGLKTEQPSVDDAKTNVLPDWILNPFKDLFAPDLEAEEEQKIEEEPQAEAIDRKPKDVVIRSKSRGTKSADRSSKKSAQVLNSKR
jgi:hypothetical protein